ncbi:MAG: DUF4954 family protein [Treponema sp.]|nr:DUF4954 family protein [Treponema sp.]
MSYISTITTAQYGYNFIPPEFLPPGKDEYWIRNLQASGDKVWRNLESRELEILIKNNNSCSNWDNFLVSDPFEPTLIRNNSFYGLIRIGGLRKVMLQYHDYCIPTGIRNSTIISCDIGDDSVIQDCAFVSHYIIGDNCILTRIDEMQATNHAKFGNGILTDGEDEDVRVWIDVMNEAGGRSIMPFHEMLPADAYLWAAYRDDTKLTENLKIITQNKYGSARGKYGVVGSHSVIKSCGIIKDVYIGEWAYIKGANKLKNISILSNEDEPTQIGEGVELVNGIVSPGCSAFYGVKAIRFFMGRNSSLKYGARLIHSYMGDNSTVSCCEILNNLIFPVHEQHHNNSFLISGLIQGMSNIAAGATIGSNHNSRANDGELRAGRGFWPGLCVTLKHPSRFASFVLISKGDYPYELNITLPFSLVNNNTHLNRLEIIPAYFWMYNLFALERNSWKTGARDKRKVKVQHIEAEYLAPDTAEEIIAALAQMDVWMKDTQGEEITAGGLEHNNRPTIILKTHRGYNAYKEMLLYYSIKTLFDYLNENPELTYTAFINEMEADYYKKRITDWTNLGGQIVATFRVDELREKIGSGEIDNWDDIHAVYKKMAALYPLDRARHAWEVYRYLNPGTKHPFLDAGNFKKELKTLVSIRRSIAKHVFESRAKDYDDPFRMLTYRNKEEMNQVLGTAENNPFVNLVQKKTAQSEKAVKKLMARLD